MACVCMRVFVGLLFGLMLVLVSVWIGIITNFSVWKFGVWGLKSAYVSCKKYKHTHAHTYCTLAVIM